MSVYTGTLRGWSGLPDGPHPLLSIPEVGGVVKVPNVAASGRPTADAWAEFVVAEVDHEARTFAADFEGVYVPGATT